MSIENSGKSPSEAHAGKRLARLAAVQALYQVAYEQQSPDQIIRDFVDTDFASLREDPEVALTGAPDAALFGAIVQGVVENQVMLDEMLTGTLSEKLSGSRMELLLRTTLRAGTFELYRHADIPAGVIINDYVDVTRAFFNAKEPGLVNAVMDKLAKKLRC